jgi:regulator of sigma E protease
VEKGDILVSVNGIKFANRSEALAYFYSESSQENFKYIVEIEKKDVIKTYEVEGFSLDVLEYNGIAPSKVQIEFSAEYQRDLVKNLYMPFVETADASMLVFRTLKSLFADKSVGISDLSGPIGIFEATGQIINVRDAEGKFDFGGSIMSILNWIGLLTVNIGLMNIIPLPALDGGRLAFIVYEAITRKKVNSKVENIIHFF